MPHIFPDIIIQDQRWEQALENIEAIVSQVIEAIENEYDPLHHFSAAEVSVVLTGDADIQKLNADFREKDKATNVLSFPQEHITPGDIPTLEKDYYLGDIILAHETIVNEAGEQDKTLSDHLSHLIVHGFLHLIGFDHMNEKDAQEMEQMEIRILQTLGIKNPYAAG